MVLFVGHGQGLSLETCALYRPLHRLVHHETLFFGDGKGLSLEP